MIQKLIIKIKIKPKNRNIIRNTIELWVQRRKELDQDLKSLFQFFENQLNYKKIRRFHPYFKITSQNPAMILSLISSLQELIPDVFFEDEKDSEILS